MSKIERQGYDIIINSDASASDVFCLNYFYNNVDYYDDDFFEINYGLEDNDMPTFIKKFESMLFDLFPNIIINVYPRLENHITTATFRDKKIIKIYVNRKKLKEDEIEL